MRKNCRRGHALSSTNTYRNKRGAYECLDCRKLTRGATFTLKQILDGLNKHDCTMKELAQHWKTSPETLYNWVSVQPLETRVMLQQYHRVNTVGRPKEHMVSASHFETRETPDSVNLPTGTNISFQAV